MLHESTSQIMSCFLELLMCTICGSTIIKVKVYAYSTYAPFLL